MFSITISTDVECRLTLCLYNEGKVFGFNYKYMFMFFFFVNDGTAADRPCRRVYGLEPILCYIQRNELLILKRDECLNDASFNEGLTCGKLCLWEEKKAHFGRSPTQQFAHTRANSLSKQKAEKRQKTFHTYPHSPI